MSASPKAIIPGCRNVRFGTNAGRVGLNNLGNTCFMNAGLQCLLHLEPLVAYFLTDRHKSDINDQNPRGSRGELVAAFDALLRECWLGSATSIDPDHIHEKLSTIAPHLYTGHEQQDVQEFLAFCLDGLHEDLNRVTQRPRPMTQEDVDEDERLCEGQSEEFASALAWRRYLETSKSFLVDLLQGQLRSTLTCSQCGNQSRCFDPFLYISVPVDHHTTTFVQALERYLEAELLTNDERVNCEKCKVQVDATKKIDLWKLPPVLVIHLKRFEFDPTLMRFNKIMSPIAGPLSVDFSKYCSSPQKEGALYEVVGVANHSGPYGFGHYTASCRVGSDWYHFNDDRVQSLDADVLGANSYVIFLARCKQQQQQQQQQLDPALGESSMTMSHSFFPRQQSVSIPELWPHLVSSRNSEFVRSWLRRRTVTRAAQPNDGVQSQTSQNGKVHHRQPSKGGDRQSCCLPMLPRSRSYRMHSFPIQDTNVSE